MLSTQINRSSKIWGFRYITSLYSFLLINTDRSKIIEVHSLWPEDPKQESWGTIVSQKNWRKEFRKAKLPPNCTCVNLVRVSTAMPLWPQLIQHYFFFILATGCKVCRAPSKCTTNVLKIKMSWEAQLMEVVLKLVIWMEPYQSPVKKENTTMLSKI